jgi:hypothetical protein
MLRSIARSCIDHCVVVRVQDQMGATSLLWRCELRNVPVADRWLDLCDAIAPRVKEHLHPFIDMHYAYALGRSGKQERVCVAEIISTPNGAVMAHLGLHLSLSLYVCVCVCVVW